MRSFAFLMTVLLLAGCNLAAPATDNTPVAETTELPVQAGTIPTTNPEIVGTAISYWRFASITETTPGDDDIVIFGLGVLTRVESTSVRTGITVVDLETAIHDMINSQNVWTADNVVIESISIDGDRVTIRLSGTISAVGGALLSIVPTQFQLTVFEDPAINSALITLNGDNLANIGASHDSQAVGNDVPFTRDGLNEALAELQ